MTSLQSLPAELLEDILSYLSMKEVLLDQRVCTQWRNIIKESPQLQRIMFLGYVPKEPLSPTQLARYVVDNSRTPRVSLDAQDPPEDVVDEKDDPGKENEIAGESLATQPSGPVVLFNPVFPSEGDIIRMQTAQFRAKLESPNSWLHMYLTQPPCSQVEAIVYFKRPSSGFRLFGRKVDTLTCPVDVRRLNGVRARDVLEETRNLLPVDVKKWLRIDLRIAGVVRG